MTRPICLPLHVGVDALWRAAGASALLGPGLTLLALGASPGGGQRGALPLLAGSAALVASVAVGWYASRSRASDAELSATGVRVHGGSHGGVVLRWDELSQVSLTWDGMNIVKTLRVVTRGGQTIDLAEAVDVAEIASLEALCQTLQARLGEQPAPLPRRADVACCVGCGAPLPPTEQPGVRCGACGAENAVDPALRERVAAQRAADQGMRSIEAAIQGLLEQPGATRASGALLAASAASVLGWLPVVAASLMVGAQGADAFLIGSGFFSGWALTFAFFGFARIALARRRALQVLSTTFGARPAGRAGEGPGCRQCGAPLRVDAGAVVRCVYCGTESVLGMNVQPLLSRVQEHKGTLDDLLREQAAERSSWVKLALAALAASALGGFWLLVQLSVARDFAQARARCERGVAQSCADVGLSYSVGSSIRQDKAAAFRYFGLACDRGHADSCRDQALQLELGVGVPKDLAQAKLKYEQACRLGSRQACDERKALGK